MASVAFPSRAKSVKINDGTTYGYVHIPAKSPGKPTLLFLHGYPSSSYDWRYQIETFGALGYEVIVPDLLGYGDTDKPAALEPYTMTRIGAQVEALLEHQGIKDNVIAIAHDWGCGLLSTMVRWNSARFVGYVFVAVGYLPHSFSDIDELNRITEEQIGYPQFGYWKFHESDDCADVINQNMETYLSLAYTPYPEQWKTHLCPIGASRAWTESGRPGPLPDWLPKEEHDTHVRILKMGGFQGPLNWYKQAMAGHTSRAEEGLDDSARYLQKPTLFVGASKDYVCLADQMGPTTEAWAKAGFDSVTIDASHWVYLEKRKEFDEALEGWLGKRFGSRGVNKL